MTAVATPFSAGIGLRERHKKSTATARIGINATAAAHTCQLGVKSRFRDGRGAASGFLGAGATGGGAGMVAVTGSGRGGSCPAVRNTLHVSSSRGSSVLAGGDAE